MPLAAGAAPAFTAATPATSAKETSTIVRLIEAPTCGKPVQAGIAGARKPSLVGVCRKHGYLARMIDTRRDAWRTQIEALAADPSGLRGPAGAVVDEVVDALDVGALRVCEPSGGVWLTHAWIKQAILLYFRRWDSVVVGEHSYTESAAAYRGLPPSFFDKLPTKRNFEALGARCVPPGVARYGSFMGRGSILMPGFINIGAYVDEGSMVDTWATVGSCAQIGKDVHLAGGVGIGGVLEPPQAQPVVVEDGAFIGSRCVVVEGIFVGREAVLGAGVVLTASTPIVDVRGSAPVVTRGRIEPRSVVIPRLAAQGFSGRLVRRSLRAGHRGAERFDGSQDLARARHSRLRGRAVNPAVDSVGGSVIRALHARRKPDSIDLGLGEPTLRPDLRYFERATNGSANTAAATRATSVTTTCANSSRRAMPTRVSTTRPTFAS